MTERFAIFGKRYVTITPNKDMTGVITQIVISWILLWIIEKQSLAVLGLAPTRQRAKEFTIGFLIPLVFLLLFYFFTAWLVSNPYWVNPDYTFPKFFFASWYVLKSVLFEELIFRGALLYILVRRLGAARAIYISAMAFGIYHWFSYGILGQPANMIVIFLVTGLMGYVLALGFYRTGSLYLPIALHLGFNFTSMVIFSSDKGIGPQLLVNGDRVVATSGIVSVVVTLIYFTGVPLLSWLYTRSLRHEANIHDVATERGRTGAV